MVADGFSFRHFSAVGVWLLLLFVADVNIGWIGRDMCGVETLEIAVRVDSCDAMSNLLNEWTLLADRST